MTTIAWDGATLAADTLITRGGHRDGYAPKIARIGEVLVGASGVTVHCQAFKRWIEDGRNGKCPLVGLSGDDRTNGGSEYALGAMSAGASAAQAVQIAAQHDTKSGGEITVITLNGVDSMAKTPMKPPAPKGGPNKPKPGKPGKKGFAK